VVSDLYFHKLSAFGVLQRAGTGNRCEVIAPMDICSIYDLQPELWN